MSPYTEYATPTLLHQVVYGDPPACIAPQHSTCAFATTGHKAVKPSRGYSLPWLTVTAVLQAAHQHLALPQPLTLALPLVPLVVPQLLLVHLEAVPLPLGRLAVPQRPCRLGVSPALPLVSSPRLLPHPLGPTPPQV